MKKMHLPAFKPTLTFLLLLVLFNFPTAYFNTFTACNQTLIFSELPVGDNKLNVVYHPETKELKVFVSANEISRDMVLEIYDVNQELVYEIGIAEQINSAIITVSTKDFAAGDYKVKLSGKGGSFFASFTVSK